MSGEHLWSDFMAPFVPKGAHDSHIETWDTYRHNTPVGPTDFRRRHGHASTRKLRRVCRACNNGWMSVIDTQAKPYVLPMMSGQSVCLDRESQKKVADWIALKCMVFENNRRDDAVTTLEQRQEFMRDRVIPHYTQIHLFHCGERPWDWQFHRHSANVTASPPPTPLHPRVKNTQSFAIGTGQLLAYVLQAFAADIEFRFERIVARQIWPFTENAALWPPVVQASGEEADRLAANIEEFIRENADRWRRGPDRRVES